MESKKMRRLHSLSHVEEFTVAFVVIRHRQIIKGVLRVTNYMVTTVLYLNV